MGEVVLRLQDAETSQRGCVITGERGYVAPYQTARDAVQAALNALDALVNRNAAQHAVVQAIGAAAARKLNKLAATIALRDAQGFEIARDAMLRDDGRKKIDAIRATVSERRERAILANVGQREHQEPLDHRGVGGRAGLEPRR